MLSRIGKRDNLTANSRKRAGIGRTEGEREEGSEEHGGFTAKSREGSLYKWP